MMLRLELNDHNMFSRSQGWSKLLFSHNQIFRQFNSTNIFTNMRQVYYYFMTALVCRSLFDVAERSKGCGLGNVQRFSIRLLRLVMSLILANHGLIL
ncbi:hypothetical protein CHS0354_010547, partial [Potamilus streckersoni]